MTFRSMWFGPGASLLAGLALALSASPAGAQEKPAGDVQNLAFFGGDRPVLLRLHVSVDGKSLRAARDRYVKQWFDFLDRDGDGVLSAAEARRVPSVQMLANMRARGGSPIPGLNNATPPTGLDADGDGKVSLEKLTAYFERAGFRPIKVTAGESQRQLYDGTSDVLFKHLDVQKQGKLSKKGVRQATAALFQKLDVNDDEILRPQELVPGLQAPRDIRQVFAPPPVRFGGAPNDLPMFQGIYSPDSNPRLGDRLLKRFDKDNDGRLTRAESGLSKEDFDQLDKNRDGFLNAEELASWHQRPPDVSLVVRLGTRQGGLSSVEVRSAGGKGAAPRGRVPGADRTVFNFGNGQLTVRAGVGGPEIRFAGAGRLVQLIFQRADTKRQGFITAADLKNLGPIAQVVAPLLPLADRNGDGKVTLAELTALMNLMDRATAVSVTLEVAEHGRALFQILDANGDGKLTLHEMHTAWDRLAPLDRNGDGFITPDEVARHFEVVVSQGSPGSAQRAIVLSGRVRPATRPAAAPPRGPVWFQKMDLNGDGAVSPREFLGTRAEFDRIDTDGDGLLSAEEAERFDATVRPKAAPRR